MTSDETFRYDPTPMNHAFPGQPDDCFDMVNQYGTYNILPSPRAFPKSATSPAAAKRCTT